MTITQEIAECVQKGGSKQVKLLVRQALDEGIVPKKILEEGLLAGMMVISDKFKRDDVFVPEVLVASRAMNVGLAILEEKLVRTDGTFIGKVVLGTVQGDWHDIGKHMVSMMLQAVGFEVIDIGYDVEADAFIDTAEEYGADIICMSALLTTTMPAMQQVISRMVKRGVRERYIVMIGGAPVNQSFAQEIEADIYTSDAVSCAQAARDAIMRKKEKNEA